MSDDRAPAQRETDRTAFVAGYHARDRTDYRITVLVNPYPPDSAEHDAFAAGVAAAGGGDPRE